MKVTAQGTKRVSMAAPISTKAGHRPQLIFRVHLERSPLNMDVSRAMQDLIAARLWLTVYQLPPYAPELNPAEGRVLAVTSTFEDLQLLDTASAGVTPMRRHKGSSSDVPATNRTENS